MRRVLGVTPWVLSGVALPLIVTALLTARAWAAESATPWDELTISFGGTAVVWGGVVAGLIQIGKTVRVNGAPLLGTPQAIWLANLALGGVGMFLYAYLGGASLLAALVQAVLAVLGASGAYEAVATVVGKGSPQNQPS